MLEIGDRVRFNGNGYGMGDGKFYHWFFDEEMEVESVNTLVHLKRIEGFSEHYESCIEDRLELVESHKDKMRKHFEEMQQTI